MVHHTKNKGLDPDQLAHKAIDLVREWLEQVQHQDDENDDLAQRALAELLKDPNGLEFIVGFIDRVIRPSDVRVAAGNLQKLSRNIPSFLSKQFKGALKVGGTFAPVFPGVIVPSVRRVFRKMISHLVVDATESKLDKTLQNLVPLGQEMPRVYKLNINVLGEAVLGDVEAVRRVQHTLKLLQRDDVDYVSIKVSSVAAQLSIWSFEETVERVVDLLLPLYECAASFETAKFINLDMEEYHDLDITVAVFQNILSKPHLCNLKAGIVLQTYLPDSFAVMKDINAWAVQRRINGGAPVKVRVVKGANLAMERIDARIHGWPLVTFDTKQTADANYKRVLDWALTPERSDAVHIGIAGHNLFDLAYGWLRAKDQGITDRVEIEMLLGVATAHSQAIAKTTGSLRLYTPVVHPEQFDVAIAYLVRRLQENASSENFMSSIFELDQNEQLFEREKMRFLGSIAEMKAHQDEELGAKRTQNRLLEERVHIKNNDVADNASENERKELGAFMNEPNTDASLKENRSWAQEIMDRAVRSDLGRKTLERSKLTKVEQVDAVIDQVRRNANEWSAKPVHERAELLEACANVLVRERGSCIEVVAFEAGKTIDEADPEVSEAIDFARYYARQALELEQVEGARFEPVKLTVVVPPWNFPIAITAGSIFAALAVGSAVIIKPAQQTRRSAAFLVELLWRAGIPKAVLKLVDVPENEVGQALIADKRVERVVLTGAYETAKLFRSWKPDMNILAETSGKNSIIVTPSADYDLAVADVVQSAFGHAGQKCSAASVLILVGSVAQSDRFKNQLIDAVESIRMGYPQDLAVRMGPLIEPPTGKLLRALTTLDSDEWWLVKPEQLDETGRLWSPGVKEGVKPGSYSHMTEFFGPVLSIMTAKTLEEAMQYQNMVEYGLTAGIHSLDSQEIAYWLELVEAGNLYVNRGITGAIVQRQPFGGWKRSSVGAGSKAGGPSYLFGFGTWHDHEENVTSNLHLRGIEDRVADLVEAGQVNMQYDEFYWVRRAALSDAQACAQAYKIISDRAGLEVERNLLRYRPVPVLVRAAECASFHHTLRVVAAGLAAGAPLVLSTAQSLPRTVQQVLLNRGVEVVVESDAHWLSQLRSQTQKIHRVRTIGVDRTVIARQVGANPDVALYADPVTTSGRIEMRPFLREQSISLTNHRFGNPTNLLQDVV